MRNQLEFWIGRTACGVLFGNWKRSVWAVCLSWARADRFLRLGTESGPDRTLHCGPRKWGWS